MVDKVHETIQEISKDEDKALNAAINNVYKKYGTNLGAFFRDVYNELTLKRQESCDDPKGGVHFDHSRR